MTSLWSRGAIGLAGSVIGQTTKVALSCVLSATLVVPAPCAAYAAQTISQQSEFSSQSVSAARDINALWEKQANGTSAQLSLTSGGAYYLTDDLTTEALLAVDAPGKNVTINLQGHTFTCTEKSMGAALRVLNAKSVTVVGDGGSVVYKGGATPCGIKGESGKLVLRDLTVKAATDDDHVTLNRHNAYGVAVTAGSLDMRNCRVSVDMSNQSEGLDDGSKSLKGSPAAVYLGADTGASAVRACTVAAIASPLVERCEEADETAGYAYALQSESDKKLTVAGGSYTATCALGDAVAISASKLELVNNKSKGVKLTAKGGARSVGVESLAKKGAILNSKLSVSFSKKYAASIEAALYSAEQNAFVAGPKLAAKGLGVCVGTDELANTEGVTALVLGSKARFSAKQLSGMFTNARTDVSSKLVKQGSKLVFATKTSGAKAKIGKKAYSSVASAIAHVKSGQTIKLLASGGVVYVTSSLGKKARFALDLNGKTLTQIQVSTKASFTLRDSSNGKGKIAADSKSALVVSGSGKVSVNGVKLSSKSASSAVNAVSVEGDAEVTFNKASITARTSKGAAVGVNVTGDAAKLAAVDTKVSVCAEGSSNAAYGLRAALQNNNVELSGCTVKVQTNAGNVAGFEGKGALSLRSSAAAKTKVAVYTAGVASAAYGIDMSSAANSTSTCSLANASVSVTAGADAGQGEYWTLASGAGSAPDSNVSWRFSGANSLVSANDTHISQRTEPLVFAAGATFDSDVVVNSAKLDNCTVARAASSGADISAAAEKLVPYAQGEYADWVLAANATPGDYRWQLGDSVRNERTGEVYQTLADALAKASAGDTVALTADVTTTQIIEMSSDVTLDLAGHRLTVEAGKAAVAGAAGSNAAIVFKGAGNVCFKDSVRSGAIDIHVGADNEVESTSTTTYQGIAVTGGGTLALEGCSVNVSYTGASKVSTELGLRGIGVVRGAVKLASGASVNVESAPVALGCTAPVHAIGIYASQASALANGANAVEVDSSSSVNVSNQAQPVECGSLHYSESSSPSDLRISSGCLTRINPAHDSALYQEIAQKFLQTASLDSSIEGTSTFDSQIYYTAPMQLDDGTFIWAYSAPVEATNLGDPTYIVPELIFEQSTYQVAAEACGVAGSATFGGNVKLEGRISATSTGSTANAIDAQGRGTWTVNSGALFAGGASGSYRLAVGTLDLRDYFDLPNQSSAVVYPSTAGSAQKVIEQVQGSSQSIASSSTAKVVSTGGSEIALPAAAAGGETEPVDGRAAEVTVTFSNLRSAAGELEGSAQATVAYGQALGEGAVPTQPDYAGDGGSTYRFIGWQLASGEVIDPKCAAQLVIDDNLNGAAKGAVALSACYVRVEKNEHLATFKVGRRVLAYAVADGKRPSFGAANAGDAAKVPTHDSVTGYVYAFKGWYAGWSDNEVWTRGDGSITTKLPAAKRDVTYTARFKVAPTVQNLYFYSYRNGVNGYVYTANPTIEAKTGEDPTPYANKIAEVGSVLDTGEGTYVLLGWSTRKTDKQPLYTTTLPPVSVQRWGEKTAFYAIYALTSQTYSVSFVANGQTLATVADVKASSSIVNAFKNAGIDEPAAPEGWEFDGWATSEGGSALRASMVSVAQAHAQAGGANEALTLYAVFVNSYHPEVYFKTAEGSVIRSTTVKYGQSAADAGIEPSVSRKLGFYFAGWTDVAGTLQSLSEPITNDIDYFAKFEKLAVSKADASKVKVSLERAGLAKAEMAGVTSAAFSVRAADSAASAVRKRASQDKAPVLDVYTIDLGYDKDGEHTSVTSGFGTVTMELPVKRGESVKILWLRSNGSVGTTATKTSENGYVSFAVADYAAAKGNLAVVRSTGGSGSALAPAVRPGASARPAIAKKALAKAKVAPKKKGAKKVSTKVTAAELAEQNAAAANGAQVQDNQETQGQVSNPRMFYIVIAAIAAFAAFLARRMYLFIAKRKEDDLDDELDGSAADDSEESIRF